MIEVEHWDETRDGPLSEGALKEKLEERGYSVSRYTYPPGTTFPDHAHGVEKVDAVLSGRFRITMGGEKVVLEAGDTVLVPQGTVQSAEVVGEKPVVSLDAVKM
ncbi:MAG: cupin domain-containing protein [Thermoanaerobaculia bacterium]|nr:cupin domain-containing protein [Thermoanaerobaculia bacterium]